MADNLVSKLTIGTNTYTLKDAEARTLLSGIPSKQLLFVGTYLSNIYKENGVIKTDTVRFKSSINSDDADLATNAPTAGAVVDYVTGLLSSYNSIKFEVVEGTESGPTTKASKETYGGTFYLVSCAYKGSGSTYDEWITLYNSTTSTYSWERIGSTDIDLSQYVKSVTVSEATFTGTARQHSHSFSGNTTTTNFSSATIPVSVEATSFNYTPEGSFSYDLKPGKTTVMTSATASINPNVMITPNSNPTTVLYSASQNGNYDSSTETLTLSVSTSKSDASQWDITVEPNGTCDAWTSCDTITGTFKGTQKTLNVPATTGTINTTDLVHTHLVSGTTENATVTPEGTVTVKLDVGKGSNS